MSPLLRLRLLAAATLLGGATAAAAAVIEPAQPPSKPAGPLATQDGQPRLGDTPPAQTKERLHIGLSDPDTKLVLPWFITDLSNAVNQGKSLNDTDKDLARGF